MSKHTPGPWHIYENDVYSADDRVIADTWDFAFGREEAAANARLIAAAPDLLAALSALVGWEEAEAEHFGAEGPDDWLMAQARAAIAKATGQA